MVISRQDGGQCSSGALEASTRRTLHAEQLNNRTAQTTDEVSEEKSMRQKKKRGGEKWEENVEVRGSNVWSTEVNEENKRIWGKKVQLMEEGNG